MLLDFFSKVVTSVDVTQFHKLCIGAGDTENFSNIVDNFDVFICCPQLMPIQYMTAFSENFSKYDSHKKCFCLLDLNDDLQVTTFCEIFQNAFDIVNVDDVSIPMKLEYVSKILKHDGIYIPPKLDIHLVSSRVLLNSFRSSIVMLSKTLFSFDGLDQLYTHIRYDNQSDIFEVNCRLLELIDILENWYTLKIKPIYTPIIANIDDLSAINNILFKVCKLYLCNFNVFVDDSLEVNCDLMSSKMIIWYLKK